MWRLAAHCISLTWRDALRRRPIATELKPDYFVLRGFEVEQNRHFHGGPLFTTERQEADFARDYSVAKHFVPPYPEILGENTKLTIYRRNPPTGSSDR